jgi:hypothetical protein
MRTQGLAGLLTFLFVWTASGRGFAVTTAGASAGEATSPVVARISVIESGNLVVVANGQTSSAAKINAPLMPGDTIASNDANTRAEIQLDGFTDVRLGANVTARLVANGADAHRIELTRGSIELALLRGGSVVTEITTTSFALRTRFAGDYRVSLEPDGTALITPRSGQADVTSAGKTLTIRPGATLAVRRSGENVSFDARSSVATDAFDAFNARRDRTLLTALEDDTHLPAGIAGYDDLNAYGRWANVASYGQVWVPNDQNANWAPYRNGEWSYMGNDGWTWIGSEPWGWIPYHYGRWLYSSGYGWCWYPPPFGFNPIWAPALVGFFGFGDDSSGFPDFGWVPLAPFETYVPWSPPRHYYPPPKPPKPPKPPTRDRGTPVRLSPGTIEFRNARFGGATTLPAVWVNHANAPAARIVAPASPALAPIAPVVSPVTRETAPVHESTPVRESTPLRTVHPSVPHPPA